MAGLMLVNFLSFVVFLPLLMLFTPFAMIYTYLIYENLKQIKDAPASASAAPAAV